MDAASCDEVRWKPDGFSQYYRIRYEPADPNDPVGSFEVSMTVPDREIAEFATARIERIGGMTESDRRFRTDLYYWVGQIAVISGHIETAMKRILLIADPSAQFREVDEVWSTLEKKLRSSAQAGLLGSKSRVVLDLLDWAKEKRIKELRDNVIHGSWWDYADVGIRFGRFYRNGRSSLVQSTFEDVKDGCFQMAQYSKWLDVVTGSDWLTLYLPRNGSA